MDTIFKGILKDIPMFTTYFTTVERKGIKYEIGRSGISKNPELIRIDIRSRAPNGLRVGTYVAVSSMALEEDNLLDEIIIEHELQKAKLITKSKAST